MLTLALAACGGGLEVADRDAGPVVVLEAGATADGGEVVLEAGELGDASPVDAGAEASSDAAAAFCGPTPFSQLRCFGRPDAGKGTSHSDACDAGSLEGCTLEGNTWCCR